MRKNISSVLGMLAALMTMIFVISGCTGFGGAEGTSGSVAASDGSRIKESSDDSTSGKPALVVVLGSHANSPRIRIGLLEEAIYDICLRYGTITLICDDGDPYSVTIEVTEQEPGYTKGYYKRTARKQTEAIMNKANSMVAKTPEVSTVKAFQLAARELASAADEGSDLKLVVLDSCLSTCSPLDFTQANLGNLMAEDIIRQLRISEELPLIPAETEVLVYNCGDTSGEQAKLSGVARNQLMEIIEGILSANGAEVLMKPDTPVEADYNLEELPKVSTVPIIYGQVDLKSAEGAADILENGGIISLDEKIICFEPGTAELVDEEAAFEAISSIAEYLVEHTDEKLIVVGATACWGSKEYMLDLSRKRAEKICGILTLKGGVRPEQLLSVGVGCFYPGLYIYDQTPEGRLDAAIAPLNRTVNFVSIDSPDAEAILNCTK